jgi:hypothetical protein
MKNTIRCEGAIMLRTLDAANYLELAKSTMEAWRCRGTGPAFVKLGKAVRYRKQDLDDFLKSSLRQNTCKTDNQHIGSKSLDTDV